MYPMFVTEDVFHALMSWLKLDACQNMLPMVVAEEVSHALMSLLNFFA